MAEFDFEVTEKLDITDVVCPVTFVKTKVALEELDDGVGVKKISLTTHRASSFAPRRHHPANAIFQPDRRSRTWAYSLPRLGRQSPCRRI